MSTKAGKKTRKVSRWGKVVPGQPGGVQQQARAAVSGMGGHRGNVVASAQDQARKIRQGKQDRKMTRTAGRQTLMQRQ